LEKLHTEMNQFVYSLSHELRGPLMSISGVTKLAQLELSDPSALEYMGMIESATNKLDDFIYKMQDFYRSTKIVNKIVEIDFNELIKQKLTLYRSKFDLKNVTLNVQVSQNQKFYSDDSKIRVILNNLFSNAVQFQNSDTAPPHIKISVTVDDKVAILTLEDNGIGIEERHQPEVFNLFSRATQKNVGTGLGLYMVKEAVEQ